MFDVMGYQITNEAFEKALLTARVHLKKGGLFIFDCWHGPAVVRNRPKNTRKIVYDPGGEKIVRSSKCKMNFASRVVDIRFMTKKICKKQAEDDKPGKPQNAVFILARNQGLAGKYEVCYQKGLPFF